MRLEKMFDRGRTPAAAVFETLANDTRLKVLSVMVQGTETSPTVVGIRGEESKIAIPDSVKAIWAAVDGKHKELTDVVAAKKPNAVYTVAEDLEALLKALPSKSSNLPADKLKRVEGQVKNAGKVLDDLHDAARDGKYDVAQEKLKIVESVIKAVRAQYPADQT